MPIEQLRYTWARKGLQGASKLQVVAASPGLLPGAAGLAQALRLCSYRLPRVDGRYPESFGWIDAGGRRFAFFKRRLPDDEAPQPGAFTAHVLMAEPAQLPAAPLLRSRRSSVWWRGLADDDYVGTLPPFALAVGAPEAAEATDAAVRLLARLLVGQRRDEWSVEEEAAAAGAVEAVAARVPELVAPLSFSTAEPEATRSWFDLVGVLAPTTRREPAPGDDAIAAASMLLSEGPSMPALRRVVAAAIWSAPPTEQVVGRLAALARITGDRSESLSDVQAALQIRGAIDEVVGLPRMRASLGRRLTASRPLMRDSLTWGDELSAARWRGIATAMVGAATDEEAASRLLEGDPRLAEAWIRERLADRDPPRPESAGPDVVLLVLRLHDPPPLQDWIRRSLALHRHEVLVDSAVPLAARLSWWEAVEDDAPPPSDLLLRAADLVRGAAEGHPVLMRALRARLDRPAFERLLRTCGVAAAGRGRDPAPGRGAAGEAWARRLRRLNGEAERRGVPDGLPLALMQFAGALGAAPALAEDTACLSEVGRTFDLIEQLGGARAARRTLARLPDVGPDGDRLAAWLQGEEPST